LSIRQWQKELASDCLRCEVKDLISRLNVTDWATTRFRVRPGAIGIPGLRGNLLAEVRKRDGLAILVPDAPDQPGKTPFGARSIRNGRSAECLREEVAHGATDRQERTRE
jgi:hypothetical protein